jgi:hypothetical protein
VLGCANRFMAGSGVRQDAGRQDVVALVETSAWSVLGARRLSAQRCSSLGAAVFPQPCRRRLGHAGPSHLRMRRFWQPLGLRRLAKRACLKQAAYSRPWRRRRRLECMKIRQAGQPPAYLRIRMAMCVPCEAYLRLPWRSSRGRGPSADAGSLWRVSPGAALRLGLQKRTTCRFVGSRSTSLVEQTFRPAENVR